VARDGGDLDHDTNNHDNTTENHLVPSQHAVRLTM
jgi:hypothetical protein